MTPVEQVLVLADIRAIAKDEHDRVFSFRATDAARLPDRPHVPPAVLSGVDMDGLAATSGATGHDVNATTPSRAPAAQPVSPMISR
jgi:hypothetical protein